MKWSGRVYQQGYAVEDIWDSMRIKTLTRDGYTCKACRKTLKSVNLTAHHIIPRIKHGKTILDNLITLCTSCHDIIEPLNLTRRDIIGYTKTACKYPKCKPYTITKDWHKWVYGGYANPNI